MYHRIVRFEVLISVLLWPRDLRRRFAAACLLGLWVRIPPGIWTFFCCECCVLTGRGLCDGMIIRPEESYRMWWVVVCDLETSWMGKPCPTGGCSAKKTNKISLLLKVDVLSNVTPCRLVNNNNSSSDYTSIRSLRYSFSFFALSLSQVLSAASLNIFQAVC
jgi:hypothetical protein